MEKKGVKVCKGINNSCEETQIMGLVYNPERDNQIVDKKKKKNLRERLSWGFYLCHNTKSRWHSM